MRKFITLAIVVVFALSLAACGGTPSGNSGGNSSTPPPLSTPSQSQPSSSSGDNSSTPPPLSTPSQSQPSSSNGNNSPSSSADPQETPDDEQPISPIEGIIVCFYDYGAVRDKSARLKLVMIDPQTGETLEFANFIIPVGYAASYAVNTAVSNEINLPSFDAGFERVAVWSTGNRSLGHERRIGWVDRNGTFTDVSAIVLPPPSDFSELLCVDEGVFSEDGYYYYREFNYMSSGGLGGETRKNIKIKRVPVSYLAIENVEEVNAPALISRNDGSKVLYCADKNSRNNELSYDSTFTMQNNKLNPLGGWISQTEFVVASRAIYICGGLTTQDVSAQLLKPEDGRILVPAVNGLDNWNPIVSPDKTNIAFLHTTPTGEVGLYTIPITGGEPVRVPTRYVFSNGMPQYVSRNVTQLIAWISPVGSNSNGGLETQFERISIGMLQDDNPPFFICSENSYPTGFEIDLIEAIFDQISMNYEIVFTSWDEIFTSLNSGVYDALICTLTVTEERNHIVAFTTPYIEYNGEHYAIAVAKDNTALLNTLNMALQVLENSGKLDEMIHSWFSE